MQHKHSNKQQIHNLQLKPLARAIRQHRVLMHASILAASATLAAGAANAQSASADGLTLEEIIVTAQKREANLQDIPLSVFALDDKKLHELGIMSFTDYALQIPSISFKSFGQPGGATIYMRGASDGGDGNASGSTPTVGLYLDEQPVTAIAANLDVHIYDVARIEAMGGPQGTLFGASSQTGTVRIITNKPDSSGFSSGFDVGGFGTDGGDESYSVEGFVNIPLGERAALRIVGWYLDEGGWIDNIAGTRTYQLEGGFGYNPNNFGRTKTIDNADLVENNFNEFEKQGLRAALRVDLSDNWTGTVGILAQNMESDGLWEYDPTLPGEQSIQRFNEDSNDDEFIQYSLTLKGTYENFQLVYAGAYLDRDVDYHTDYTAYGEDAYFVPYYACDYSATGPDLDTQSNTDCTSLEEFFTSDNAYQRQSHELRLLSMGDGRLHYTLGLFYEDAEHQYFQQWIQPGISQTLVVPSSTANLYFRTDQVRTDEQKAVFGEITYDFTESLSGTFGFRFFDEDHELQGVVGWGPSVFAPGNPTARDTIADSKIGTSDEVFKFNLSWKVNDDILVYGTFSQGYRPGGLNRDPDIPSQSWEPDFVDNYEFGWKTTWNEGRVRWNGAAYFMEWDDIQFTKFDFSISACCGNVFNLSTAEVKGFETDISVLATESLTLSAAVAYNDGETTGDFVLPSGLLSVPDGTKLPNVAKLKGNLFAKYTFTLADFPAYAQINWNYTGSSYSEIEPSERFTQDSYSLLNFRTGINLGSWGLDLYVHNLTDENAQIYVQPRTYEPTVVTNRPRSFGFRYFMRF